MTSVSSFANTNIVLQFSLDRDIDAAAQDVQAAINAAKGVLPTEIPNPPVYQKVNPADTPILTLALSSDSLPLPNVNELADTILAQKLSEVTGVGLVLSRATKNRRCGCASIRRRSRVLGLGSKISAPRWRQTTSTSRKAASTDRGNPTPSVRTTRFSPPTIQESHRRLPERRPGSTRGHWTSRRQC